MRCLSSSKARFFVLLVYLTFAKRAYICYNNRRKLRTHENGILQTKHGGNAN